MKWSVGDYFRGGLVNAIIALMWLWEKITGKPPVTFNRPPGDKG